MATLDVMKKYRLTKPDVLPLLDQHRLILGNLRHVLSRMARPSIYRQLLGTDEFRSIVTAGVVSLTRTFDPSIYRNRDGHDYDLDDPELIQLYISYMVPSLRATLARALNRQRSVGLTAMEIFRRVAIPDLENGTALRDRALRPEQEAMYKEGL
jgi:hypothetical protein